jgi:hypothetical protein
LAKLKKTDKWDAEGGLDKSYLTRRIEQQKSVEFFNGLTYLDLVKIDEISGFKECNWESVPQGFKDYHNWSIKCMANRTDIEFGDFKRISGLEKDGKKIKISQLRLKETKFEDNKEVLIWMKKIFKECINCIQSI